MKYIDVHAHMTSRTTDDYYQMALTGCVALADPAFWSGYDHSSPEVFADYFDRLTDFEPKRAAKYGLRYYTWLGMNPKEAEDRGMSREVLKIIPEFLDRPNVLGLGEIGVNRVTRNEVATFEEHAQLALDHGQMIHIHTPHLEDKFKGTQVIIDALAEESRVQPERVLVDHVEEHTIKLALDRGYWAGITLYPMTKTSHARAVDMIEMYGTDRILVAGACDWGPSDPVAMPKFVLEMRRRGHSEETINRIVYENPIAFLRQSPRFEIPAELTPLPSSPPQGGRGQSGNVSPFEGQEWVDQV